MIFSGGVYLFQNQGKEKKEGVRAERRGGSGEIRKETPVVCGEQKERDKEEEER
jgi:hypothetical protein